MKLVRFGFSGPGHPRELVVKSKIVLNRDCGERLRLTINLNTFLGLNGLMQPVAPSAAGHFSSGMFVNYDDLIFLYDIIDIFFEEAVAAQKLSNIVNPLRLTITVLLAFPLPLILLRLVQKRIEVDFGELRY